MPYGPLKSNYDPISKVPVIGRWYGRIGKVYKIWSMPCSPSPIIAVYAAWVSAPRLLWSLFKPDFADYKYEQIKSGFKRHGRRGKFKIHEEKPGAYPTPRGMGWQIFRIAEAAQRIGWYLSVIDATTEGLVNWSTLTYEYSGCLTPDMAYANLDATGGGTYGPGPGTYTITDWTVKDVKGLGTGPTGVSVPAGWNYMVTAQITTEGVETPDWPKTSPTCQVVNTTDGTVIANMDKTPNPDGTSSFLGVGYINLGLLPFANLVVRATAGFGLFKVTGGNFSVYASQLKLNLDLKPDP